MVEKTLEPSPEFNPVVIPDGIYNAKVKDYRENVHPKYGESLIIDFEITDGPHKGKIVAGFASWRKLTKKTKLYKWATNLNAPVPTEIGEPFNPDNLIGKTGRILTMQVQRIDREGKPFWQSIVKDVLGAEGAAPSSSEKPITPEIQKKVEERQNKMELLKQFEGKSFTEEDLKKLGFSDAEIDSLRTMGYIYEPKPGELRLVSG